MTRLATVVLSMLLVLSPVTATAAVAAHGSAAPPATSTPGSSPPPVSGGSGGPDATTRAAAGELSPGLVTDATTSNGTTNDTGTRPDGVTTAGRQQSTSGQSPYTATVVPHQPDIKWGGRAIAVDVHPQDSSRAIVASESGGLFETTDGGATWSHLDGAYPHRLEDVEYADPDPSVIVLAAETDSRNLQLGGRVVSGGGIWVSRDGGGTWTKPASAEPPASSNCRRAGNVTAKSVAFEPGTNNVYVGTSCGLAVSTDLGRTWTHEPVDRQVRQVGTVIAPARDTIDICTRNDGHFRYRPSSDLWQVTGQTLPWRSCHWGAPYSLAASPADPDVLFAVVPTSQSRFTDDSASTCNTKRELFESDDGGQTWTDLNAPGCTGNRIPLVATSTAAANGEFTVYVGKGVNTHRQNCSTGAGSTRCSSAPGDWDQNIGDCDDRDSTPDENICVDHSDNTDIAFPPDSVCPRYLTNDGGVEKTSDCGKHWTNVGNSSSASGFNALQLYTIRGRIFEQPDHTDLYFGTQDNGQWAGERRGQSWSAGPGNEGGWMGLNRTAVSHSGGEPVMVHAVSGHSKASDRGLSRIGDWPNPPGIGSGSTNGSKVYYLDQGVYLQWNGSGGGSSVARLWRTTNTGQSGSWTALADLPESPFRDTPVVGPTADPAMYVPQENSVKRITNLRGGSSATVATVGFGLRAGTHVRGEGTYDFNTVFEAIPDGPDPDDRATLIMPDANDNVMKVSRDGGQTWQTDAELTRLVTDNGGFRMDRPGSTTSQASEIAVDPGNASRIFVGTEANGVIASFDGGDSWGRVPDTRKIPAVSGFFFDGRTGGDGFRDVYVASYGRGIWKIDDVNKLKPVPKPDSYDRGTRSNDDPGSPTLRIGWQHVAHLRCPDESSPVLGRQSPGDDCSAVLTDPNPFLPDDDRGAPLEAKETWRYLFLPHSLDGTGDEDFYQVPEFPNLTTHRNISRLPHPECGRQVVSVGGRNKTVETTAHLSIIVEPMGNQLARTPVRTADGATPINVYDGSGRQLDIGTTVSDGNKLIHRIQCPQKNGYEAGNATANNLTVSFGEGVAANSGGYQMEYRYRIDVSRPDDIGKVLREVERIRGTAENAGKYERVGEGFPCRPSIPRGNPCVYKTEHPIGVAGIEGEIPGGFCEEAICRQRWQLRRAEERPFELSVLGNENMRIELQRAERTSDGDEDPDGEVVARSESTECIPPEEFGQLLAERGRGATVREVGTDRLVSQMGQGCDGTSFSRQATETTPEGAAPVRHRLAVDALEPGLYQLVITGPRSAYWLESFTLSVAELEEGDAASVPEARLEIDPVEAVTEEPVTVNASRATDADGSIVRYEWRFGPEGEGRTVTTRAATATHTFREPGEYPVRVTVTDDDGNTDTVTREVFVAPAPAGEADVSLEPARKTTGDCPVVDDNRIPDTEGSEDGDGEDGETDEEVPVGEEGFEEEGLPCTVYDPATPRVDPGERIRYDVVVENANTGIAAAGFTIALTDGSVADITGVTLGPNVATGREANVDLPADTVEVSAEELTERLGDARGRTVVATVTVEANGGGTADLVLSDTRLRDPRGDDYTIAAETGASLVVEEPEPIDPGRYSVGVDVSNLPAGLQRYNITYQLSEGAVITGVREGAIGGQNFEVVAGGVDFNYVTVRAVDERNVVGEGDQSASLFSLTVQSDTEFTDHLDPHELTDDAGEPIDPARLRVAVSPAGGVAAWPTFQFDVARSGHSPDTVGPKQNPSEEWAFGTDSPVLASPSVHNGTAYVGTDARQLYALDASDGSVRWSNQLDELVRSAPAIANGNVYVTTRNGTLYAFDASTGARQWRFTTAGTIIHFPGVLSSPAVADGTVYFGSINGNVYAVDASAGTEQWRFESPNDEIHASPAVVDGTVYVGGTDEDEPGGGIYALDASTGSKIWNVSTDSGVDSSPTVRDGTVYAGVYGGDLLAVDVATGTVQWRFQSEDNLLIASPAVGPEPDGPIYAASGNGGRGSPDVDGHVYALDDATGHPIWSTPINGSVFSSPALVDGVVYVGSDDGGVYALRASDGSRLWRYGTGGEEPIFDDVFSSPAVYNGTVYVGDNNDTVHAIAGDLAMPGGGVDITIDPAPITARPGTTTTVDVQVTGVDGGVGSYELVATTSDASTARIVNATNRIGGTGQSEPAEGGVGVRIGAFAGDTDDTGNVTVATVTVAGVAPGTAGLAVEADSVADEAGAPYNLTAARDLATVTVRDQPQAPEVVAGSPATDPDSDNVYEDVNGDGEVTPGDATVLFNAVFEGNEAVTNNPEQFDLNGDGDVNPGDATVLFNEVFRS